jgi:hypothetical protein
MKSKVEIEAALERSLRRQIQAPKLADSFDAAVWSRIDAQKSQLPARSVNFPATAPTIARWLGAINVIGLASVTIFLAVYGAQMLPGAEASMSLPKIAAALDERVLTTINIAIAAASLLVGFAFTPWGQRLRDEFV